MKYIVCAVRPKLWERFFLYFIRTQFYIGWNSSVTSYHIASYKVFNGTLFLGATSYHTPKEIYRKPNPRREE